ncbi:hypothetical protein [Rhizobium leguminosarum]|uniref:hypothetical protein n=1 Tax=Rhizobium leguminosarum TaxID=384 RepID=UPI00102F42F6|nr:hypothetical protein [Rhizobium leguminosarum]TBF65683.1 hypothetical protein ELG89_34580 [Rhizobium leguminosarum]
MRYVLLLLAYILVTAPAQAQQVINCDSGFVVLASNFVPDDTVIRVSDETRRDRYALSLLRMSDFLFVRNGHQFRRTDVKLSSIYASMLADPVQIRRFFSTKSELARSKHLQRELFAINAPGSSGVSATPAETEPFKILLTDEVLRSLRNSKWLSEFPALVLNNRPNNRFRELTALDENSGDFLVEERAYDKAFLLALGDTAVGISGTFVSKSGVIEASSFPSLTAAFFDLQSKKTELCAVRIELSRLWLHAPFVDKYSNSERSGNIHKLGQISMWREEDEFQNRDLSIFPLLSESFIVSSLLFTIAGDRVVFAGWELQPFLISQQ